MHPIKVNIKNKTASKLLNASSNDRNKIQMFRIDKNIILRLHLIEKKLKIVFDGTILYANGLQLQLSTNYWKLINDYHKLQTSSIVYVYNFDSNTVNVRSYINFVPNRKPQQSQIEAKTTLIKQNMICFVDKLYQFGMINFYGKFCFQKRLSGNLFNKKIINKFTLPILMKEDCQTSHTSCQTLMVDESLLQLNQPNILICPIQPLSKQIRSCDLPFELQYGPKNFKHHFGNGAQLNNLTGGFFSLQKLLCSLQKKKLQKNQHSNFFNSTPKLSQIQRQVEKSYVQTNILVKKSLKLNRQESSINRLKILKELVIVRQIQNSNHLITYYLNSQMRNFPLFLNLNNKNELGSDMKSLSSKFSLLNVKEKELREQYSRSNELREVYMDFHPHTLGDYIGFEYSHFDSKIKMCLQMINSIIDIHKSKVIHRDLKPQNALIDFTTNRFKPTLKLIDFSESAIHISENERFQNPQIPKSIISEIFDKHNSKFYAATMPTSPPQCQLNRQNRTSSGVNNFSIDYWSLAMMLFEICMGKKLLNCFKAYQQDIMKVIKDVGFENYFLKVKRGGFRMLQNAIQLIAIKNINCNQSKRMSAQTCYDIINTINQQFNQWTNKFNNNNNNIKMCFQQGVKSS